MKLKYIACCIFLLALIGCKKEELPERTFPGVTTLPVTNLTEQGATFHADVIHGGTKPIIKYGFVWSKKKNPKLEYDHKVVISKRLDKTSFSKDVKYNFDEEFFYYVRAFVETEEYLIYGSNKKFFSLGSNQLEIDTIYPLSGTIGDTVYIEGKNFIQPNYKTKAHFHNSTVKKFIFNDSLIAFVIPSVHINQDSVNIYLTVFGNAYHHPSPYIISSPEISEVNPSIFFMGDTFQIHGEHFSQFSGANKVKIKYEECQVIEATKNRLKVVAPDYINRVNFDISLTIAGKMVTYQGLKLTPPEIDSISPSLIEKTYIDEITVFGNYFFPTNWGNEVYLNGEEIFLLESSMNKLIIHPQHFVNNPRVSLLDTFDLKVSTLEQETVLEDALIVDYQGPWTKLSDFPGTARIYGASFAIDGNGYVGLGEDGVNNYFKDMWKYNPQSDQWHRISDFPSDHRSKFASFVLNDKFYLIGGLTGPPADSTNITSEVWAFDPFTERWEQISDFPGQAVYNAFGFSLDGMGYLGAGTTSSGTHIKSFWKYDPETDDWIRLNDIDVLDYNQKFENFVLGLSTTEDAYILGHGCLTGCNYRYFWKYDLSNDDWITKFYMYGSYFHSTGFAMGDKIYVGPNIESGSSPYSRFVRFDNSWEVIPYVGERKSLASSFSIDGKGYILLGSSDNTIADKKDCWLLDPTKFN